LKRLVLEVVQSEFEAQTSCRQRSVPRAGQIEAAAAPFSTPMGREFLLNPLTRRARRRNVLHRSTIAAFQAQLRLAQRHRKGFRCGAEIPQKP
jgi:hypothetical protein